MANTTEKLNKPKTVMAHARNLHIAPRKVRLVTNMVKGMPVETAITQLQFTNKKAAGMVLKLIKSAVANAEHNFSLKPENLVIQTITCDMGPVMKRYFPRARGSAFVIRRKTSHINIILEDKPGSGPKKKAKLETPKKEVGEKKVKNPEISQPLPEVVEAKPVEAPISSEEKKTSEALDKRRPQEK